MTQFKVMKCEHCGNLTYKRLEHETVRCPTCQAKMKSEPVTICDTAKEAVTYIKDQKLQNAPKGGNLFERFG